MWKIKTIIQPIEFAELFDAKVNELLASDPKWGFNNAINNPVQLVAHDGAKSDLLIAHMMYYSD